MSKLCTQMSLCVVSTMALIGCNLEPLAQSPKINLPSAYKEQPAGQAELKGAWKQAEPQERMPRGEWWKVFGESALDDLETQAVAGNPALAAAAARVEQARATARANNTTLLPKIELGGNAVRSKPSDASAAAFGAPAGTQISPYTLYSAQAMATYEADLFGRVRSTERAFIKDADAQAALYQNVLLVLQADVAHTYFALRALDAERALLRDSVKIRTEANRIMKRRYEEGVVSVADKARTESDLAATEAELLALDRQRTTLEHALATLLGKLPSEFSFAETPLQGTPPAIPADLPSSLLERRPDIVAATNSMAAANARIGVAKTAFFPRLLLTAFGGVESLELGDLFKWSSRTWALGQLGGTALNWTIFDNGRNEARLNVAQATYEEAVANYRQQVLVAFQEVENQLASQRLLAEQAAKQELAAKEATLATAVVKKRYDEGDVDYFELVETDRASLALSRAAIQAQGQRFITTVALIRALGGGWTTPITEPVTIKAPVAPALQPAEKPQEPELKPQIP